MIPATRQTPFTTMELTDSVKPFTGMIMMVAAVTIPTIAWNA